MGTLLDLASLVMIPSGVKEDKLYSVKPTDGSGDFTFSRNSDIQATRVNSSGLIEKAKVNLLLQSNTFDTTWTTTEASVTGGQTGYDGSSDAWLLSVTSGTGSQRVQQSISASGLTTYSVYVQKGTTDWVALRATGSPVSCLVWFDLTNGVKGSNQNAIDYTITSISGDWYRCTLTTTTTIDNVFVYPATSDDLSGLNCTSGDTIYIQDAMLNHGLIAQDYVETTTTSVVEGLTADLPRLDYSGGASCPSLLLEPQRTNLVDYSEYLGGWVHNENATITDNDIVSPDGGLNASKFEFTADGKIRPNNSQLTFVDNYSFSIFIKKGNSRYVTLSADFFTSEKTIGFDLDEGTAQSGGVIEPFANDWYRLSISQNVTGDADKTGVFYVYLPNTLGAENSVSGNYAYAWGAQVEEGSYPTSYIPTYGASAQRNADSCSKTGISSLIGQTEGTVFVEVDTAVLGDIYGGNNRRFLTISDGTTNNRIVVAQNRNTDAINLAVITSSTLVADISTDSNQSGVKKIAVAYANNDFVLYVNGVQIGTDTSGGVPPCSRLGIGVYETSAQNYNAACPIKQTLLFKTRLSNAELAALTTI